MSNWTFSGIEIGPSPTASVTQVRKVASGSAIFYRRLWITGDNADTVVVRLSLLRLTPGSSDLSTLPFGKLNSLSSSSPSIHLFDDISDNSPLVYALIGSAFLHGGIFLSRPIVVDVGESIGQNASRPVAATSGYDVCETIGSEEAVPVKFRGRRPSKQGSFAMYGACMSLFSKSGGGAYTAIRATFDNDLIWFDPYVRKLGNSQSDFWNINLFGTPDGAIAGQSDMAFGQSGAITGAGALNGTAAEVFGSSATLTGAGAIRGTSALTFSSSSTIAGTGNVLGTSVFSFSGSSTLLGAGAIVGTSTETFGSSSALLGAGAFAGTSAFSFGQSATLTGAGAVSSTAAFSFGSNSTLAGAGALLATSAFVFDSSATVIGAGSMASASAITFSFAATISGVGALASSSSITFDSSADLSGVGTILGSATIVFDSASDLTGDGSAQGSTNFIFDTSANVIGGGAISGELSVSFDSGGEMEATGQISGESTLTFDSSAEITGSQSQPNPPANPPLLAGGGGRFSFPQIPQKKKPYQSAEVRVKGFVVDAVFGGAIVSVAGNVSTAGSKMGARFGSAQVSSGSTIFGSGSRLSVPFARECRATGIQNLEDDELVALTSALW